MNVLKSVLLKSNQEPQSNDFKISNMEQINLRYSNQMHLSYKISNV